MKKSLLIVVLALIFSGSVFAQGKKKADTKPGSSYVLTDFRGIKWGVHIDSVFRNDEKLNFVRSSEVGDKGMYTLANDEMMIGTVLLDNIYYTFNKQGRFIGVLAIGKRELENKKQLGEMKYILTYKFGDSGLREIPSAIQYYWNVDDVRITLNDEESKGIFTLEFYSDYERSESKRINMSVSDF
jgi:hypothetical protein